MSYSRLSGLSLHSNNSQLYELSADLLQPFGGLDPTCIRNVHCEEGILELHYKPPNAPKVICNHLCISVQMVSSIIFE